MKKVELLAPAGSLDKVKLAFSYGADAVYLGGEKFGMRRNAIVRGENAILKNEQLKDAVDLAHQLGKKVYITVNIFARNSDFDEIKTYVKYLESIKADAVIVSDLGVMQAVRENTGLEIHVSTQASVLNKYTANEYIKLGAKRIILARECSLEEIKEIADTVNGKCEIEVFVHGLNCIAYSGNCMLAKYMDNRDPNRGECTFPCRLEYALVGKHKDQYFPIEEDAHGTYIMNSKDLCLINYLDKLVDAGVTSFKIEGRRQTEYYVAAVVSAYRRAIDGEKFDYMEEINKIPHRRPWTTGFLFNENDLIYPKTSKDISDYQVVAKVVSDKKVLPISSFNVGDELEILSPKSNHNKTFTVTNIRNEGQELTIDCPYQLLPDDFLRKRRVFT
jgi:putative protease